MKSNSNHQNLQECWIDIMTKCRLIDALTTLGILENEPITVYLKHGNDIISERMEINPAESGNYSRTTATLSEADISESINIFLRQTQELFKLKKPVSILDETAANQNEFTFELRTLRGKCCFLSMNCGGGPTPCIKCKPC